MCKKNWNLIEVSSIEEKCVRILFPDLLLSLVHPRNSTKALGTVLNFIFVYIFIFYLSLYLLSFTLSLYLSLSLSKTLSSVSGAPSQLPQSTRHCSEFHLFGDNFCQKL